MINIAIVEDDKTQAELLERYLEEYKKERDYSCKITHFDRALKFLSCDDQVLDVVFMDIELPDGNGMEAVKKMREYDKKTIVIFVTNLAQYAVKGYEVKAFDFIVKPVAYYNFTLKFASALDSLETQKEQEVWVKTKGGQVKLWASRITYVEVQNHYLTYHTIDGDFMVLGSIGNVAAELKHAPFSFCNRCYFVNLKYVTWVDRTQVLVDGDWLQISRAKRTEFLKDLNDYLAGGN